MLVDCTWNLTSFWVFYICHVHVDVSNNHFDSVRSLIFVCFDCGLDDSILVCAILYSWMNWHSWETYSRLRMIFIHSSDLSPVTLLIFESLLSWVSIDWLSIIHHVFVDIIILLLNLLGFHCVLAFSFSRWRGLRPHQRQWTSTVVVSCVIYACNIYTMCLNNLLSYVISNLREGSVSLIFISEVKEVTREMTVFCQSRYIPWFDKTVSYTYCSKPYYITVLWLYLVIYSPHPWDFIFYCFASAQWWLG